MQLAWCMPPQYTPCSSAGLVRQGDSWSWQALHLGPGAGGQCNASQTALVLIPVTIMARIPGHQARLRLFKPKGYPAPWGSLAAVVRVWGDCNPGLQLPCSTRESSVLSARAQRVPHGEKHATQILKVGGKTWEGTPKGPVACMSRATSK